MEKKDIKVAAANKILTVVIPTYNMEKYLRRCLDSLIVSDEQMKMLEVLVINDGSKDTSSQIAHEYQDKYPQTFRVIDKENGNYGSCVNRGLQEATGKYIRTLDADDWFDNDVFRKYMDTIKDLDVDLIMNDFKYVRPDGEVVKIDTYNFPTNTITSFFPTKDIPQMHGICYNAKIFRKINYHQTEGISYTDTQWNFFPMSQVEKMYYYPTCLYMYVVGREGQTMDPKKKLEASPQRSKMLKGLLRMYVSIDYPEEINKWMINRFMIQIESFYHEVIFVFGDEQNMYLIEFDTYFKEHYPDLYKLSEKWLVMSRKCPYKYIRYWRKHHKLNHKNILVLLYQLYLKLTYKSIYKSN